MVQQLREQLQQDSQTSSRDPPQAVAQWPRRPPTGLAPGGQPGHEGQTRALVPVEEVNVVIPVKPERCRRCQHPLVGTDPHPQRHQVTDISPVKPVVTEYQWHQLACLACVEVTQAALPVGVPTGGFGPRVQELLGEQFWGWLVTDRWSAYAWYPIWRQLCWAHLLRDIEAMVVRGGCSQEIGEALQAQSRQRFHWWHRVCDGTLTHVTFRTYMQPIRWEVERLLEAGQTCGAPKTGGTCREVLKQRQALWTFVRHEGVEPTNNAAERAIRPVVLWRKGSFGTQSADGSRFVEAMMTGAATLKQQHRNVLDDLTTACEAALYGEPPPSLLPTPRDLTKFMCPRCIIRSRG